MNKYTTLRDNLTRDIKHLDMLKRLYKKRYRKRQDPVLLRALRKREIELTLMAEEVEKYVMVD